MARFGLLDSDDEGVSDASSQHSDSNRSATGDSTINSHSSHSQDEDDQLLEDAPPQASLLSDEEPSQSEDDDSMDQPPLSHSRRSRSYSHQTRTPSPPRPTKLLPPPTSSIKQQQQQQQPWAQQLNLEPKKVQLMQASFFGQDTTASTTRQDSIRLREREREEKEQERDKKRKLVEQGFANRVKQGKRDQASLFASTSTPVPAPTATQSVPTPILDPAPFRPYRTYTRVPLSTSTTNGKEQNLVDSGLALARSSRVGWGPNGEMISLRGVYDKEKEKEGKSDVVKIEKLKLLENNEDKSASLRLLELQLSQTQIFPSSLTDPSSSSSVPFASPNPSLRFSHFVELFNKTPSDSQTTDLSNSSEAQLFKLASLLFDEIPSLGLSSSLDLSYLPSPSTYTSSITSLRRVELLSSWLTHSLLPSISSSLHSPSLSSLEKIFLLLTTHQISQACDLALSSNNVRLATLIAQIGTVSSNQTDGQFQRDLADQLSKWREFKVDSHVSVEVRKIYELLSGNLGVSEGRTKGGVSKEDESKEFHVLEGREWKAAFAMGLWYSRQQTSSTTTDQIVTSLNQYDSTCFNSTSVSAPTPSYLLSSSTTPTPETPLDPIYHLLKLYTSPTHSLEQSLNPLNFGPSPTDYRLPWHLYLMFSRVLRRRDFEDRVELDVRDDEMNQDDEEEEREGNSVRADSVTVSYAQQLESLGMWEWSAFVLMHLELELPRKQALESLILRNVSRLTPQTTSFLTTQLSIPSHYLSLARLTLAESSGQVFSTYKLLLTCQFPEKAHRIVVEELCPEAIVRGDEGLCKRLLEPFREDREEGDRDVEENDGEFRGTVEGWDEGGKIYLQYLHTLSLFSDPSTSTASSSQVYLSSTIQSIQGFVKQSRTIERMKGNKKLRMALSEMSSRLNVLSRAVGGKALNVTQPSLLGESEKLVWLQGATGSFLQGAMKRAGVV